jgi:hypothetical protein
MLYQVDGFPYYVRLHVCWNCVGTIPSALGHLYLLNVHKTDYTCYYSNMIHCIYNADAPLSFIFYPERNAFLNYTTKLFKQDADYLNENKNGLQKIFIDKINKKELKNKTVGKP